MDISLRGMDLIISFEGKHTKIGQGRYKAYLDTLAKPPVWTLYCGLTRGIREGQTCTEEEGQRMFQKELTIYEDAIERLVTVPLNQNQFDALVSYTYNCGIGALQNSTLLKVLNAGKYEQVPAQLMRWVNAGGKRYEGLVRRRKAEGALFAEPMPAAQPSPEGSEAPDMPQRVEEAKQSVPQAIGQSGTAKTSIFGLAVSGALWLWQWVGGVAQQASIDTVATQQSVSGLSALFTYLNLSAIEVAGLIGMACLVVALLRAIQRGR